jgi:hypothetical protein
MTDKVVDLKLVEQRRIEHSIDKGMQLQEALTKTLFALLHAYEQDQHWLPDAAVLAMIEVLVACAGDEQINGLSVIKRLANRMVAAAADSDGYWEPAFARWFVADIPAQLKEYEDFQWYSPQRDGA